MTYWLVEVNLLQLHRGRWGNHVAYLYNVALILETSPLWSSALQATVLLAIECKDNCYSRFQSHIWAWQVKYSQIYFRVIISY